MQKKKPSAFRTDLRPPLIVAAVIGILLLCVYTAITFFAEREALPLYGAALCGVLGEVTK